MSYNEGNKNQKKYFLKRFSCLDTDDSPVLSLLSSLPTTPREKHFVLITREPMI